MSGPFPNMVNPSDAGPYNYPYNKGGSVWIPSKFDGGRNRFVRSGVADLVGTVGGTVTFGAGSRIPNVAGYGPAAAIATAGSISATVPLADGLQMFAGGTFIALYTATAVTNGRLFQKSSSATTTRNGYTLYTTAAGAIGFITSDNGSTDSQAVSATALVSIGERVLVIATLDGANAVVYKNCTSIATSAVMQTPANIENDIYVGNRGAADRPLGGSMEFCAMIPGVIFDTDDCTKLSAMCGLS